jgi:hypothetical protein
MAVCLFLDWEHCLKGLGCADRYALTPTLFFGPSILLGKEVHLIHEDGTYESIGVGALTWSEFHNSINETVPPLMSRSVSISSNI